MSDAVVYGAGSWGTALAVVLAKAGNRVALIGREKEEMARMAELRENKRYLPGVVLPPEVSPTADLNCLSVGLVVISVPSQSVREAARLMKPHLKPDCVIVNTAKGLESGSYLRLSEVIADELPGSPVAVLSGPSHAEEVARNMPTTVVVASDLETAEAVQDVIMTSNFRVYTNPDVIGVELGGALKNIIALCMGIAEGLGFGYNSKAALMTRGLAEITRLGVALGGNPLTFSGLAGVGDLIVTCTSPYSRNRRAGLALGQGQKLETVLQEIGMVVEGVTAARTAYDLSREKGISMPITEQAYKVLFEGVDPKTAVLDLMGRGKRHELEELWGHY